MLTTDELEFLKKFHRGIRRTLQSTEGASIHRIEMSLRNYELCKSILKSVGTSRWWKHSPEVDLLQQYRTELCVLYQLDDDKVYVILD